jgi:hypothetical protein
LKFHLILIFQKQKNFFIRGSQEKPPSMKIIQHNIKKTTSSCMNVNSNNLEKSTRIEISICTYFITRAAGTVRISSTIYEILNEISIIP